MFNWASPSKWSGSDFSDKVGMRGLFGEALHRFAGGFVGAEGGEAEVAFALQSEAYAWGADDLLLGE